MRLSLYFTIAAFIFFFYFHTSAQEFVIGLQQDISLIQSSHNYDGIIFDEDEYMGGAYNLSLYVHKPIYKNFFIEARVGGFDMEYENNFDYLRNGREYDAITRFESIQQHFIGFYPGFFWKGNTFSFSLNTGVDFYVTRTTVSETSLSTTPISPFSPHPTLSNSRIGYQVHANLYFMMEPFAFTMGMGYRRTHLFRESDIFPSHNLNVVDLSLGVAYFISEKKEE